jgi:hypothetical protein
VKLFERIVAASVLGIYNISRYAMAHRGGKKDIDWDEVEKETDRQFQSAFGGGKGARSMAKRSNEAPTFNTDKEGYDSLLSGEDKVKEQIKFSEYLKAADEKKKRRWLDRLSKFGAVACQRVLEFRNTALSNAWNALPEKSPLKQLGPERFFAMFHYYDPIIMCITDHSQDIPHSLIMHRIVFGRLTGKYDKLKEKSYWEPEYWFVKQERWACENDTDYLCQWGENRKWCEGRINKLYINRPEPPVYYDIISAWCGGIDAAWDGNDVIGEVTIKDIKHYLKRDQKYKDWDYDDNKWKEGFKVARKLVAIAGTAQRGKDQKQRHRAS